MSVYLHPLRQNGVIAQLVEQRTENPCVPGSIPGDATKKQLHENVAVFCFDLLQVII